MNKRTSELSGIRRKSSQLGAASVTQRSQHLQLTRRLSVHLGCNPNNAASKTHRNPNDPVPHRNGTKIPAPVSYWGIVSSYQKSWSNSSFALAFPLAERTFWRQQPGERCRKHIPWGEKLPQASESLFTTSCACYFHQNRALSFSPALFFCAFGRRLLL